MASFTYYVVVLFDRTKDGGLRPGEGIEAMSYLTAYQQALALAPAHAGVVAFFRTGDPGTGQFSDANVIVSIGDVDLNLLQSG